MNTKNPKNILMLNLTRMGDMIQSTPLLQGLRAKHPDAKITLLVGSDFYEFSKRLPCVDEWIVLDLRQFKEKSENGGVSWPEIYHYFEKQLNLIREKKFDLVFNLSHSKLSAFIISYLRIQEVRGFKCNAEGDRMTDHPWLQYFFTEPFNRQFNTFNLVDLFSKSGDLPNTNHQLQIASHADDDRKAEQILQQYKVKPEERVIGFQAGSSLEGRRWPPHHFARLADLLTEQLNVRIILFGVKSEKGVGDSILKSMRNPHTVLNLIGETDIGGLTGLVKRCDYLVTNDTGTMHIAAALDVPIVGLFFAHAHPPETGPFSEGQLLFQADIPCAPCSYGVECNQVVCVEKLSPELVASMIRIHQTKGEWAFPVEFKKPEELKILVTERSPDSSLRMRPLLPKRLTHTELFSWMYRRLWLDTLGQINPERNEEHCQEQIEFVKTNFEFQNDPELWKEINRSVDTVSQLENLGVSGLKCSLGILKSLKGTKPDRNFLTQTAKDISKLDEEINLLGLVNPELKPITDIFNKRKENIDGNDLRLMTMATLECYEKLVTECRHLTWITGEFERGLKSQAACEDSEESSIRMEVPGR